VVKTNATISGAAGGCQAEIGTACAMGCGLASYIEGLGSNQIDYAAEIGIEHNLGLTCDPVGGYVQIPCIERNGVAALRCLDAMNYARYIGGIRKNRVSFDMVVNVMKHTGKKIPVELRETSLGGLALEVKM
jgi:L-serine dehydratase